jgi:hypothetical protein
MHKTPQELYNERMKRVNDVIQLKTPDRVPIVPFFSFFVAKYAGIDYKTVMYDYDQLYLSAKEIITDFEPDMCQNFFSSLALGPTFKILDYKQLKWPGNGVAPNVTYQYVEDEYMKADEYNDFLFDPSGFTLRTMLPRICGALEPFSMLSPLTWAYYIRMVPTVASFGIPEVTESFHSLLRAGAEATKMSLKANAYIKEMEALGFPCQYGASVNAPFDYIADTLRGTKGAMMDMYRQPEKLLEMSEKVTPIMVDLAISSFKRTGVNRVLIPLHKGPDGLMSLDQFNKFYWPSLKKLMCGLIDKGLVPCPLFEGDYTSRLEIIGDMPKGKCIYWFERTDIFKAKAVLGDHICIRGNVPATLLCTGTPQDIRDYCKILIDIVGKDGGFIMDGGIGIPDEAKVENVKLCSISLRYTVYIIRGYLV